MEDDVGVVVALEVDELVDVLVRAVVLGGAGDVDSVTAAGSSGFSGVGVVAPAPNSDAMAIGAITPQCFFIGSAPWDSRRAWSSSHAPGRPKPISQRIRVTNPDPPMKHSMAKPMRIHPKVFFPSWRLGLGELVV